VTHATIEGAIGHINKLIAYGFLVCFTVPAESLRRVGCNDSLGSRFSSGIIQLPKLDRILHRNYDDMISGYLAHPG
jgi:hypothetical protein